MKRDQINDPPPGLTAVRAIAWLVTAVVCLHAGLTSPVHAQQQTTEAPAKQAGQPESAEAGSAAQRLRERHDELAGKLQKNAFGKPLYLESSEREGGVTGDVYAQLDQPFATLQSSLVQPAQWCEVLILHLNVKHCESSPGRVKMNLGSKHDQPLENTYQVSFVHQVVARDAGFLQVQMKAADGPLGTRDYLITLQAIALDAEHSFLHFRYSYNYGTAAKLAMQAYLGTVGSSKIGFSVVAAREGERPAPVGGMRGAIERNAMRYYLAIASYLDSLSLPENERVERRLHDWFAATERYAPQLHEIDQDEYMKMKRGELARK